MERLIVHPRSDGRSSSSERVSGQRILPFVTVIHPTRLSPTHGDPRSYAALSPRLRVQRILSGCRHEPPFLLNVPPSNQQGPGMK